MKKAVFFTILLLFATVSVVNISAADKLKLVYNNEVLSFTEEIVSCDDEFFIDAKELSGIMGISFETDAWNEYITLEQSNSVRTYAIRSYDYSIIKPSTITHDLPEQINGKIYFPFHFIENEYDVIIKYDKEANILYFFPENNRTDTFTNPYSNYTLDIPDSLLIDLSQSYEDFNSNSVFFTDNSKTITASVNSDVIDESTLQNMRLLLSDNTSTDEEIFKGIAEYKQSYFRALQDSYRNEFLFGNSDETLSESNIKIVKEYSEKMFGQDSNIILFNTIKSDRFQSYEEIHISITIPAFINHTIYSLNFTMKKGALNDSSIKKITQLLKGLSIQNLPMQQNAPEVLSDSNSITSANSGIYPPLSSAELEYHELEDISNLYKLKYPSTFVPYLQNSFIDNFSYRSFKIDYNNYISISAEQIAGSPNGIDEKINSLKAYYGKKMEVISEKSIDIDGKDFLLFEFGIDKNGKKEYIIDYFITNGIRLYTLELHSLLLKPSESTVNEFDKIVSSFEILISEENNSSNNISFHKFSNDYQGYSIFYPVTWELKDNSKDINYDSYSITNPNLSGPLDISINESEYISNLTPVQLQRYITGYNTDDLDKYFKNYVTPYSGRPFKVLKSSIHTNKNTTVVYKLVNYLDEGDRYKLCYSIDIIKNSRINSLYICGSEYLFQNGTLKDKDLSFILNFISKSFSYEDTKEYLERLKSNEKRNKKLVFIENYFKIILGKSTVVTYAKYLSSSDDVLVYLNNCRESGAYRLDFDYANKTIHVASCVLQPVILKSAEEEMKRKFKDTLIQDITVNQSDMTISVKYMDNLLTQTTTKSYYIEVVPTRTDYRISFVRKYSTDIVKNESTNFLENHLLSDVNIYLPQSYNYLSESLNKYYYEKRYVPLYAEFNNQSGYFYLEIDPVGDSIRIVKYISLSDLYDRIEKYYSAIDTDINLMNYDKNDTDNFSFNLFFNSKTNDVLSTKRINVSFEENSHDLQFKED